MAVRFYYFDTNDDYNNFISVNGINSEYLYFVGDGFLYKGNKLIAENSVIVHSAVQETIKKMQQEIEENYDDINVIKGSIDNKVDKKEGLGLSQENFTTDFKTKLEGIADNANNFSISIDSILRSDSENPVQNKVIKLALDEKVPTSRAINGKPLSSNITLSASDVGADESGTANLKVINHNEDSAAHSIIQNKVDNNTGNLQTLTNTVNTHINQKNIHITDNEKEQLKEAYNYSQQNHATKSFSNIAVGTTTIQAEGKDDTLTLVAGNGISIEANLENDEITIQNNGVKNVASGTKNGTINVDGSEVKVTGLGSAAYASTSDFASASIGELIKNDLTNTINSAVSTHEEKDEIHVSSSEKNKWDAKADSSTLTSHITDNVVHITANERTKWNSAEANQNAFSSVKIGDTSISANSKTAQLTLTSGENITLTPNTSTGGVTISAKDTVYTLPAAGASLGGVKNGGDVSISNGVITVKDDSHSHTTSTITGLDNTLASINNSLSGKVSTSTTINDKPLSSDIDLSATDVGADPAGSASTVQQNLNTHTNNANIHFTAEERTKLSEIQEGAQKNTITGIKGDNEPSYRQGNVNITKADIGLGNVNDTSDDSKPVSTAQRAAINEVKDYIDDKIDAIVGEGASESLDTIGEISKALDNNPDIIATLNQAIGNKVDKKEGLGLSQENFTTDFKTKLSGIASGAEVNQNAFGKISDGTNTLTAAAEQDTITFAGSNASVQLDSTNKTVTVSVADGTTSVKGIVKLSNSTSSTSTALAATAKAVKTAYDKANSAYTLADNANTLAASKAGNLRDLGVEVEASKINYLSTVTSDVQGQLNGKVPTSRTINGKALSSDIDLSATDVGASKDDHTHSYAGSASVGGPATRTLISDGSGDAERKILITSGSSSGQNVYSVSGITANCSKGTLTAKGGFIGTADEAKKLTVGSKGSDIKPVYFTSGGIPEACSYTLEANVPSNAVFTDHIYEKATATSDGLLSSTDFSKLQSIQAEANKYVLPMAGYNQMGGVSTTSDVSDPSGYTACPIIGGTPYYKDTNTTYTLASFGITATKNELNILDGVTATKDELNILDGVTVNKDKINFLSGVTSDIQTQLDGKAPKVHPHDYAGSTSAGGPANSAARLTNQSAIGSTTQPVYFTSGGVPEPCSYTLGTSVPSNAVFTDTNTKVTQNNTTENGAYRVLLSGSANNTSETTTAKKSGNLTFNPSTGVLNATQISIGGGATLSWNGEALVISFS